MVKRSIVLSGSIFSSRSVSGGVATVGVEMDDRGREVIDGICTVGRVRLGGDWLKLVAADSPEFRSPSRLNGGTLYQ